MKGKIKVMDEREEFDKIMKEIEEKLTNNPELKAEIQNSVANIERILGYEIDVSVIYNKGVDEYQEIMDGYDLDDDDSEEEMKLSEFISFIQDEELDNKVMIDPLYLKNGLNYITNILVTTIDDSIIIVPKTRNENE